ncbi:ABC transporter substrate-binding protein [Brevibacterium litoralis]|uniref:ABC transporter substrate-binding protein n=1 Tax=Brevibacterium litoralis TaxID=3138935 RepID=UPI0032EE2331
MVIRFTPVDPAEALLHGPDRSVLRICAALPLTGVLGIMGPSSLEAVRLAYEESEESRSASDRPVEIVLVDSGADAHHVAEQIAALVTAGGVEAIVGLHTSDTLRAVLASLGPHVVPYYFAPSYEDEVGGPMIRNVGESSAQTASQLAPVMAQTGARTWGIVGSDYLWGECVGRRSRHVIEERGGSVVLDVRCPLGAVRASPGVIVDRIGRSGIDGVVLNLPASELLPVLRELKHAGLDRTVVRYSGVLEENVLYALGGDRTGGLFSGAFAFNSSQDGRRGEIRERLAASADGPTPVLNAWSEHTYVGLRSAIDEERCGGSGPVDPMNGTGVVTGDTFGMARRMRLGRADGLEFDAA